YDHGSFRAFLSYEAKHQLEANIFIFGIFVFKHIANSEEFVNVFVRIGFGSTIELVSFDKSQIVTFYSKFICGFKNCDCKTESQSDNTVGSPHGFIIYWIVISKKIKKVTEVIDVKNWRVDNSWVLRWIVSLIEWKSSVLSTKSLILRTEGPILLRLKGEDILFSARMWTEAPLQKSCMNTASIHFDQREARSKENPGSIIYSSQNAKIPSGRRNGHASEQQFEAFKKSHLQIIAYQVGLESVEARIVVHQKNEAVYEEDIALLKIDVQLRDNFIKELKNQLESTLKEKDDLKLKLEKSETSSNNLAKLMGSQLDANNKTSLGYGNHVNGCEENDR
nr:hypothetical protein [Tanacetum cinerariifolium]